MPVKRSRRNSSKTKARNRSIAGGAVGLGVAALATAPAAHAATFTVTNLSDSGPGSLREAVINSNSTAGDDVITFQAGLTGTIALTSQLALYDSVDIQGPGATAISVSGGNTSRVFYLYSSSADIEVRIADLTITEGAATVGAGIVSFGEDLELDGVTLTANVSGSEGGGLFATGSNADLVIRNSTISGNTSGDDGGGIYIYTSNTVLIEDSVVTGNTATADGGGIYLYTTAAGFTIRDSSVTDNNAAYGGGFFFYDTEGGAVTMERITVSGNQANSGGGLFLYALDDATTITNSTISGNSALTGAGGGIFFYDLYAAATTLDFVTVVDNQAAIVGGGIHATLGELSINNSIVADNSAATASDLGSGDGSFELRYTLLEDTSDANYTDVEGNIFNQDPQLAALADNGGPTETHRPALDSPVVNAADPAITTPTTDQRGQPREYPVRADMGALELVGGVIQFDPNTAIVSETAGSVTLTVVRDVGPDPATVDYATSPGTATGGGTDYTTALGTVAFAPGDLSETIEVLITNDGMAEADEQFTVVLSDPSPDATLGPNSTATVTITDVTAGQFVFSSATYSGNESGGSILITVNRVGGSDGAASVNYSTVPGSATPGADYTTTSGTLTWNDGDMTSRTFSVPVLDDSIVEGNETFSVQLDTPVGGTIGSPDDAVVTIIDDPAGTLQFSTAIINTTEEAGSVTVTVTRTGGTEGSLSANYATANGSAVAPSDYIPAAGTVTFPAGDATPQTFNIGLVNDAIAEPAESFSVTLTGAAVGSPSTAVINLAASDEAAVAAIPTLSWWGRMLMLMMTAMAGLYVMIRNRFSMFLIGLLLMGVAAAPPTMAAEKASAKKKTQVQAQSVNGRKAVKGEKFTGTVQSLDASGANLLIKLTDGRTVTVPKAKAKIVDARGGRAKGRAATQNLIAAGAKIKVKFHEDAAGNVTEVRVRITG